MVYNFARFWDLCAGHQSNLYSSTSNSAFTLFSGVKTLSYYKSHGILSSKLILYMLLYGHAFSNLDSPKSPFQSTGKENWELGV